VTGTALCARAATPTPSKTGKERIILFTMALRMGTKSALRNTAPGPLFYYCELGKLHVEHISILGYWHPCGDHILLTQDPGNVRALEHQ
jgi:hypothetical protein